ncbi:15809_t:CDS:1, partial [Racocetra persica]
MPTNNITSGYDATQSDTNPKRKRLNKWRKESTANVQEKAPTNDEENVLTSGKKTPKIAKR